MDSSGKIHHDVSAEQAKASGMTEITEEEATKLETETEKNRPFLLAKMRFEAKCKKEGGGHKRLRKRVKDFGSGWIACMADQTQKKMAENEKNKRDAQE